MFGATLFGTLLFPMDVIAQDVASPVIGSRPPRPSGGMSERNNIREKWIQEKGFSSQVDTIRQLVVLDLPADSGVLDSINAPIYQRTLAERYAQDLAVVFGAAKVKELKARGVDLPKAAAVGMQASLEQIISISELVVVGKVIKSDPRVDLGDGYYSTTTFEVEEVLNGTAKIGQEIRLREGSGDQWGMMTRSTSDVAGRSDGKGNYAVPGTKFILFISSRLYPFFSYMLTQKNVEHSDTYYVSQWMPLELMRDRVMHPPGLINRESLPKTLQDARNAAKSYTSKISSK